uniref:Protein containing RhoGAP domain n=1 Tax=Rhipicephalus zambeziensis TaxID=60191 RepID=A0A224YYN5_9ACAR
MGATSEEDAYDKGMHQQQQHQQQQQHAGRPSGKLSNVPRKLWRSRAKSQSRVSTLSVCSWSPEGCCRWRSRTGGRLTLRPTTLVALTETEAMGFRPLAVNRLQSIGIGCKVDIPREDSTEASAKLRRRPALLRKKAITTSFFESRKESADIPCGQVFGVGLQQVVQSDRQRFPDSTLAQPAPWSPWDLGPDVAAADALSRRSDNASESSLSSLADFSTEDSRKDSVESLRHRSSTTDPGDDDCLTVHGPQVPRVVNCCLRYLESYGLNTVGIFRVSGSKRRVRQLREEFDSGREVHLDQERPQPHDVAQLLKEYLRDLPQPLLTRDLYQPFLYTQRVREKSKQLDILRQLVRLLPTHSRDTLWALLKFLNTVAENSVDKKSSTGQPLPGNKMDAHNLATMLGPNILRFSKTSEKDKFIVENLERAEERCEVILVVRQLIENYEELFRVSAEDLDSLYKRLLVESPEDLEILLRRRFYSAPGSQDDDGSDQVFDGANAEDDDEEPEEEQLRTVLMRPVTTVTTHRGRERRSTAPAQQQEDPVPYILITPEARGASERRRAPATSKGRGAEGDDDDDGGNVDVEVSFTLKMPSAPNVPAYLTEATSESSAAARPLRKPTREASPPSSATTEEEVTITIEAAPTPAARKSKGSSRRFLSSKEKEEKAFKINKSKSASSILSFFGGSSESRRDSGDASSQPPSRPAPRRDSREVRFQTEKWRRCEIISSEHTDKRHK